MKDFEPLRHKDHGERLLVSVTKQANETKSGLLLAGENRDRPLGGQIKALAKDSRFHMDQQVYFSKYSGHKIKIDDKDYFVLFEDDIVGVSSEKHQAVASQS